MWWGRGRLLLPPYSLVVLVQQNQHPGPSGSALVVPKARLRGRGCRPGRQPLCLAALTLEANSAKWSGPLSDGGRVGGAPTGVDTRQSAAAIIDEQQRSLNRNLIKVMNRRRRESANWLPAFLIPSLPVSFLLLFV